METIEEEPVTITDDLQPVTCTAVFNCVDLKYSDEWRKQKIAVLESKLEDAYTLIRYMVTAYLLFSVLWFGPEVTLLVVLLCAIASIAYARPWLAFLGFVSGACARYWPALLGY